MICVIFLATNESGVMKQFRSLLMDESFFEETFSSS